MLSWLIHDTSAARMTHSNSENGYDEFTDTHSDGTDEKETTTAHTVDQLDTHNGHDGIDYISDDPEKKFSGLGRSFWKQTEVLRTG